MTRTLIIYCVAVFATLMAFTRPSLADEREGGCNIPRYVVNNLQSKLAVVVNAPDHNGGLFTPNRMWSAIVDRQGRLCSVVKINDAWPGSREIAIAKASTANDFSNSALALSTAMLYGPTQPGGSLYGLNNSNPFNPLFNEQGTGIGFVPGGIITFGGGVPLYVHGQVIGGLGVSGDTSCGDAAIAYRMRKIAGGLTDGIPNNDNISYYPTPQVDPSQFEQPHCAASDLTPAQIAAYSP